jgi:hypothetical protein
MTIPRFCKKCGTLFQADWREVNRGNGHFCSLSCAANWGKNSQSVKACRARARRLYKERHGHWPLCRVCGIKADIHHKDGNPPNNEDKNHDPLCRSHHVSLENTLFPRRKKKDFTVDTKGKDGQDAGAVPATSTN